MKTIEKRAKKAGTLSQVKSDYPYDKMSVEFGYTQGATEQKVIDNKRAKHAFDKACGWLSSYIWYNEMLEKFVKAIEEEL